MTPWEKFAILGSTYARALGNAATRGGRELAPAMQSKLTQMGTQPQAQLQPGLGQMFREHAGGGERATTPQQQGMQHMLARAPWAGDEHGGHEHSVDQFNAMLRRTGREQNTPAGQPTTHQQIAKSFGPPQAASTDATASKVPYKGMGGNPYALMDDFHPSGTIGLPGVGTRVGPAPAPRGQAPTPQASPQGPVRGEHTMVSNGQWKPPWQRFAKQAPMVQPQRPLQTQPGGAATSVMRKTAAPGLGLGIPLALGGGMLANKPGIKANVRALAEGGSTKERDEAGELPEPAIGQANAIRDALTTHGMDPAAVRMGIDAPPGSGKTTLARALAQQAGMKHYSLDWEPGNAWKSTIGLGRNVEKMPHTPHPGEVLEHYMLGRTYDPDLFDAMVHIHRDPSVLREQLQHRGHGAYIGDMMDLDKSLNVADLGFNTLGGDVIDLGNGVQMKLRPQDGWGDVLDQRLMAGGIDPTGMSRHEKLLSLHAGKKETGAGWTPYVKSPFTGAETAALGASIPLGMMASKALRAHPR